MSAGKKELSFFTGIGVFCGVYAGIQENLNDEEYIIENEIHVFKMPKLPLTMTEEIQYPVSGDETRGHFLGYKFRFDFMLDTFFPLGRFFNGIDSITEHPFKPSRFFMIHNGGKVKREECLYLIGHAHEEYGEVGDLPQRMSDSQKNTVSLLTDRRIASGCLKRTAARNHTFCKYLCRYLLNHLDNHLAAL